MPPSPAADLVQESTPLPDAQALHRASGSTFLSVGALAAAAVEGVCAGLVLLKGVALLSGLVGLMAAGASSWVHADPVRIPLMVFAAGAALANLLVMGNGWRLRRSPAASWRVRPLTMAEKRRTVLVAAASLFTLALIVGEIYGHHVLHAG